MFLINLMSFLSGNGIFEIQFKCDSSALKPQIIKEKLCHVALEYPTQDACELFETDTNAALISK